MAHILLIDDSKDLQESYASFLEHEGHEVATASSIAEALEYLSAHTPDLLLLDMLLPKMNGLELLREYDVKNAHKDVKVIAFSNLTEMQIELEAGKRGVQLYLNKARTTPESLASAIRQVLAGE